MNPVVWYNPGNGLYSAYSAWVEPTLHQIIWGEIERELNLEVFGEISLTFERMDGKGFRIQPDLIGFSGTDYYGFEVKLRPGPNINLKWSKARKRRDDTALQLSKMAGSRYFDYSYLCCLEGEEPPSVPYFIQSMASQEEITGFYPEYDKIGILVFGRGGSLSRKMRSAEKIERENAPRLLRDNEEFVRHHVFLNEECEYKICEGILPNPENPLKTQRIDIVCFRGSDKSSVIYRNQDSNEFDLIGIEAKGKNFNIKSTYAQLRRFIDSGGLTRLYFAFPKVSTNKALELKERLPEIGLISVNTDGNIELHEEAERIRMECEAVRLHNRSILRALGRQHIDVDIGFGRIVGFDGIMDRY